MNTKLTLRIDESLVKQAKAQAAERGKSVSQMFGEFITALDADPVNPQVPPVTESLVGIIKERDLNEESYKKHLLEKHS